MKQKHFLFQKLNKTLGFFCCRKIKKVGKEVEFQFTLSTIYN